MSSTESSKRLALRVLKARFFQKKQIIKTQYAKLTQMRSTIRDKERELDDMEAERSATFSSGPSLFSSSDSESDDEKPGEKKAESVGKHKASVEGPPPKATIADSKCAAPPPKATVGKTPPPPHKSAAPPPKAAVAKTLPPPPNPPANVRGAQGSKPKPKAGFQTAKAAARQDPDAPQHNGYPNAEGILYPGFPKGHEKYCVACDQLRQGFLRAAKAHRKPSCEWAPWKQSSV